MTLRRSLQSSRVPLPGLARVFKTRYFAKQARDAGIGDAELCEAAEGLINGQGNALGGGVWKKRLDKNRHRSIVITKSGTSWFFAYLFAKKDRENVSARELLGFRKLAKDYDAVDADHLEALVANGELKEICHEGKA